MRCCESIGGSYYLVRKVRIVPRVEAASLQDQSTENAAYVAISRRITNIFIVIFKTL